MKKIKLMAVAVIAATFLAAIALHPYSGWLLGQSTQTASSSAPSEKATSTPAADNRKIYVASNATEFANAIGSNRIIQLKFGDYNLAEAKNVYRKNFRVPRIIDNTMYDGYDACALIRNCQNLKIECPDKSPARILIEASHLTVLTFEKVSNIELVNLEIGHTSPAGSCDANVVEINESSNIRFKDTLLFGCGAIGLVATKTNGVRFDKSTISSCSVGIMNISDECSQFVFEDSVFESNNSDGGVYINDSFDILFKNCRFESNKCSHDFRFGTLFVVNSSSNVKLVGGSVTDNDFNNFSSFEDTVTVEGTEIKDNPAIVPESREK